MKRIVSFATAVCVSALLAGCSDPTSPAPANPAPATPPPPQAKSPLQQGKPVPFVPRPDGKED